MIIKRGGMTSDLRIGAELLAAAARPVSLHVAAAHGDWFEVKQEAEKQNTKMCHHRTLPLGISRRYRMRYNGAFLATVVYALLLAVILVARGADGFTCQTKRLMSCPRVLHHPTIGKRHPPVASSHTFPSIYRGHRQTRFFAVETNNTDVSESAVGTVTILVPSPSSSGPSNFTVSEGDAPLSYLDAAKAIAAEVSSISANSIKYRLRRFWCPRHRQAILPQLVRRHRMPTSFSASAYRARPMFDTCQRCSENDDCRTSKTPINGRGAVNGVNSPWTVVSHLRRLLGCMMRPTQISCAKYR